MNHPDVIAVDPGTKITCIASFYGGRLRAVEAIRAKGHEAMCQALGDRRLTGGWLDQIGLVVVEVPQIYRGSPVRPNDLIKLAVVCGAAATLGDVCEFVKPRVWKGTQPKAVHHPKLLAKLDADERKILDAVELPASLRHNLIDAVGIGLWRVGR